MTCLAKNMSRLQQGEGKVPLMSERRVSYVCVGYGECDFEQQSNGEGNSRPLTISRLQTQALQMVFCLMVRGLCSPSFGREINILLYFQGNVGLPSFMLLWLVSIKKHDGQSSSLVQFYPINIRVSLLFIVSSPCLSVRVVIPFSHRYPNSLSLSCFYSLPCQ